tara:strand:+ start:3302 stop:4012 length:711 start_codon:yes stop_codon:yes gene_type:complete
MLGQIGSLMSGYGSLAGGISSLIGGGGSSGSTFLNKDQAPFLKDLWGQGSALSNRQMSLAPGMAADLGGQLTGAGFDLLGGLQNNPFMAGLQQQAGGNPALVEQQASQMGDLLNQFAGRAANTVGQTGVATGGFGQSRGQIARGIIGEEATRAYGQGLTDLQTADAQRALQAGTAGAGINAQAGIGGLSQLGNLFNVGMSPFSGAFLPLQLQSSLLGAPVMESQQSSGGSGLMGLF